MTTDARAARASADLAALTLADAARTADILRQACERLAELEARQ